MSEEKVNISYEKAVEYAKIKHGDKFNNSDYEIIVSGTIYDYMLGYMQALEDKKMNHENNTQT